MEKFTTITELMTDTKSTTLLNQNQWQSFNFTQSFDTSLPLCSFFLERSPHSNLFVAPAVNVRQVDPRSYTTSTNGKIAITEAICQENNTTFSARKMVLYPFVITKQDDAGTPGVTLISVSRGKYVYNKEIIKNTSVVVTNIKASNVTPWEIKCLYAFFNHSTNDQSDNIINWEKVFRKDLQVTDTIQLMKFLKNKKLPEKLVNEEFRFEVNMRNVSSFIQMCTNIRICYPEGQHRMECASRVLYGYPLLSPAPLRDDTERTQKKCDMNTLLKNLQCVESNSTIFGNIPCMVYYSSLEEVHSFDGTYLKMLQRLSSTVQSQATLEVETSYHSFYFDLNKDINKEISQDTHELLSEQDWANLSLEKSQNSEIISDQEKLFALHRIINQKTVFRIYHSLPFNKDLPVPKQTDKTKNPVALSMQMFLELAENAQSWPTNSLKWKLYHTNLQGKVKGHSTLKENYTGLRKLSTAITQTADHVLQSANWKSLQVHILFDLFFAMKTESVASETLNAFLSFGDSDMQFYNPYWLAAYVFAPINTICTNMTILLTKHFGLTTGADATSKQKVFIVLKRLLLVEYLQVIMQYADNDIGKKNKSFIQLKTIQSAQALDLQQIEKHKLFLRAVTFMDMLLLTLPESINNYYVKGHEIPLNGFTFTARNKGNYSPQHIPTIQTFIPPELLPSTILKNEQKVTSYSTPVLKQMMATKVAKPKKKNDSTFSNPPPPPGEDPYEPSTDNHPPTAQHNFHNVQIGKLCRDYAQIIENVDTVTKELQTLHAVMVRAKARNNHRETLQTIIGNIQILADTKLDDECTAALNAYTESQLKNNTVTRAGAKKRKRVDGDNGDAVSDDDPDADTDADE